MPDPRGLFLGPISRGGHVSAIYFGPSAIQQAPGPPPDHQMYVPCRWGGSWGAQRPHQPGPTSVTCVCVCARRVAPFQCCWLLQQQPQHWCPPHGFYGAAPARAGRGAARRSGKPKPLENRGLRNLGAWGPSWRTFKGNSGVGVRFPPSRSAQLNSVCLYLAQQPPDLGHLGRPQRAQIGRPVSSSFSRHAAFPCQPVVLGCGTDPIQTAQSTRGLVWDPRGACGGGWARALYLKFASVCSAHISTPPVTASPPAHDPAD